MDQEQTCINQGETNQADNPDQMIDGKCNMKSPNALSTKQGFNHQVKA